MFSTHLWKILYKLHSEYLINRHKLIKKDNTTEPFDRNKLLNGLIKACEKRPFSLHILEKFVDQIEEKIQDSFGKEIKSSEIGESALHWLYDLDEIAYVRFASVYREFRDINQFINELQRLSEKQGRAK